MVNVVADYISLYQPISACIDVIRTECEGCSPDFFKANQMGHDCCTTAYDDQFEHYYEEVIDMCTSHVLHEHVRRAWSRGRRMVEESCVVWNRRHSYFFKILELRQGRVHVKGFWRSYLQWDKILTSRWQRSKQVGLLIPLFYHGRRTWCLKIMFSSP